MKIKLAVIIGLVFSLLFSLLLFMVIVFAEEDDSGSRSNIDQGGLNVSAEVLVHKPTVEKYCKEFGIEDYINYILAIMQVESGGKGQDVMQSSESLGLPPKESIKQGCKYFSQLLASANSAGCDINSVIQSYNYGGGYIGYVAKHGKKHTYELAESFSKEKAGGVKVDYPNPIAIPINGGWHYNYGNQFYGATRF